MFALNVYPNKFVHTIIIWNVQFHLASFYLMASLLTLPEADIYLAGSLIPEILLTVQILSTQLQILSTQSTKYRQMSSNIDKCQQISTNIDFNVIFPGFLTEFQGFSRISRIFLNSRVFPGFPGFPGSVDTLFTHPPTHTAARPTAHSSTLPPTHPFTRPPTYPYTYLMPYWFLVISPPMHTYVSGYLPTFAYLPIYAVRTHQPTHTAAWPTTHSSTLAPTYPFTHPPAAFPPTYPYTYLTPYWSLVISLTICQAVSLFVRLVNHAENDWKSPALFGVYTYC